MLTDSDRALLRNLDAEPLPVRNDVAEAATAARRALQDAGLPVSFTDPHAALDAAIYRYVLESRGT